jgi:hypothetical protein
MSNLHSNFRAKLFWIFFFVCLGLGWVGNKTIATPFYELGQFFTIFYFFYFYIIALVNVVDAILLGTLPLYYHPFKSTIEENRREKFCLYSCIFLTWELIQKQKNKK